MNIRYEISIWNVDNDRETRIIDMTKVLKKDLTLDSEFNNFIEDHINKIHKILGEFK